MEPQRYDTRASAALAVQGFRLSPQQEHLCRVRIHAATGSVVQGRVEIEGDLNAATLRRALERVIERHEILRTTFQWLPGLTFPVQVVEEGSPGYLWAERDLSGLAAAEREDALERIVGEDRASLFDPTRGPLLRVTLVRVDPGRRILLLALPALSADTVSLHRLTDEIALAYAQGAAGDKREPPLQYPDAAEILHEWLETSAVRVDLAGWEALLRRLAITGGSRDAGDAGNQPAAARTLCARLGPDGTAAVARAAERLGTPVPLLLLAAWYATLWHTTGEGDVVVGLELDGRTCIEMEEALGLFARCLPVRCGLGPGSTLRSLVASLAPQVAELTETQDGFPLDAVERLLAAGDAAPVWPFGFACRRPGGTGERPGGSPRFTFLGGHAEIDRCELRLAAVDALPLRFELQVDSGRIWDAEAGRLLARFVRVLEGLAAAPDLLLAELDVLSEIERREILEDFNATAAPGPADRCFHDLFAEQARLAPHATAVAAGDLRMTYAELDARASRLAHRLRALGVAPESLVGLCCERSPEMVVGLLATLKAGGAYVPLDPGYPAERLAFLLEDSGVSVLLTQERLLSHLPANGPRTICLDGDDPRIAEQPAGDLPATALPESPAYVIYTSGSTGKPKGVVVPHRGLVNYLRWAREAYEVEAGKGAPVHSAIGFDLTVTSLLSPLVSGTAVILLPDDQGVGALATALRGAPGFSLVKITPAHLEVLRHVLAPEEAAGAARALVIGGDALTAESLAFWRESAPDTRLINEYGPTETVVGCCVYEVRPGDPSTGPVPIGRPIANARLYIMGSGMRPVVAGVPGELWISGAGVARGYLGRPKLTAERFVPDPFGSSSGEPGARAYRTGDLVRLRPDGEIEFLGRIDDQVKIRGFRIEPGEIEAALVSHPGVREAVVATRGAGANDGSRRLVAWFVPREPRPSPSGLRLFLAAKLPEHMVPAVFVPLESLPLTAHGKVDRRTLPEPPARDGAEVSYAAPRTVEEELLAEILAAVLGVDRVGIDDNFFTLGGDSIRSVQVLSLARERGLTLSLQELFRHPTIRGLSPFLRTDAAEAAVRTEPFSLVSPTDRERLPDGLEDAYPLSRLQAGMLFHSAYSPGSAVYHDIHSFHLRGVWVRDLLQLAVDRVVRRHSVLRTSFDLLSFGVPVDLVHVEVPLEVTVDDLRDLSADEQRAAVGAWLNAERHRGFDWARPPLMRFHVQLRGVETFQLTLSFHHSVLDGWSAASLLTELFRIYTELLAGVPQREEPAPKASFRDFVELEQRTLASAESQEFWRRQLEGATLSRIAGWPAPASPRQAGDHIVPIPADVADGLRRLARLVAVPLKSVLLAAHLKVMSVWTSMSDVTTGMVVNGRPEWGDGDQVLGLFLNTVPVRFRLGRETWEELAHRAFEVEWAMLPHRRFPLADLQAMQGGRSLFETLFNFLHFHVYQEAQQALGGLAVLERSSYEEMNIPLGCNFQLDPGGSQLLLRLNYVTSELTPEQVAAMAGCYARLLADVAGAPARSHLEAPILSETEREQILSQWSDGGRLAGPAACLHELFAAQAANTPHRPALVGAGRTLTYAELDAAAGALARRLRALGAGPERLVGLCASRGPGLVIGALAILKAGSAYVPLDPAYPAERLAFTLSDCGAPVLLTERGLLATLPLIDARIVCLDEDGEPSAGPAYGLEVAPDHLAYVIYTSGSTGRPKGVAISHRAAAAVVSWAVSAFPRDDFAAVLASTSICFDLSVFEIFVPLACGGTVVLAENALALSEWKEAAVTLVNTVPSAMAELLRMGGLPDSIRAVGLAGEPLQRPLIERIHAASSAERVYNLYGPTEDTTYSTWALMRRDDALPPSIGRPVAGGRVYLLDAQLGPVPAGVLGEIWLGGAGLARGYLGRPDLTAERFLPCPFSESPGERLYRTGDLGRFRPDGEIEFFGRIDHQVKVRGYRIELGEIEAALVRHPSVREAVAIVRNGAGGDLFLVAYVVPHEEAADAGGLARELWAALRAWLPEPMVPTAWVVLDALPLTPNGKVDRQRLPEPERPAREAPAVPPRGPVEEALATFWQEVLGVAPIGARENFFELGGHSLLATRVMSRVQATFRVEVPLRALFDHPTVAGLAAVVEAALHGAAGSAIPPLEPRAREGDQLLSFAQQRLWIIDQLEPGSASYNLPIAVRLIGRLDQGALDRSLGEVVSRHESLRTTFPLVGSQPAQRISAPGAWHLPLVDLRGLAMERREREMRQLTAAEALRPFDLARGPLLRGVLVRVDEQDHVLLLTLHHIVTDAWSMGVLVRELAVLYPAFLARHPSPLPPLPLQYADFAHWQREWLQGEVLERQISYWEQHLAGAPPTLDLPADRPRPALPSGRGGSAAVLLPSALSASLAALGRREGVTLFIALLTAFNALLHAWTGREDLVVGTDVANRNRAETEGLIGFFVNQLVMRTSAAGDPEFRDLLARVREAALGAYAHQELPFERLVEELQPERDLSRQPLFQVVFAMQNVPLPQLDLPDLTLIPLASASGTVKLDLSVVAADTPAGLRVSAEYTADLFDAPTVARLLRCFGTLLEAAAGQPELRLSDLPLLGNAERHQVAWEWNDSAVAFPANEPFHRLFARRAAAQPGAIAAVCGGESLTYSALDAWSDRLARSLAREGVGPEAVVALIASRDLGFLTAILGIFKAGGAYLPLDPLHPIRRLVQLLRDSGSRVVLTIRPLAPYLEEALAEIFPGGGPRLLLLEDLLAGGGDSPDLSLPSSAPESLAYVIYTSGSTGFPKGAMVEQRGMLNHLLAKVTALGLDEGHAVAQTASQCFDISVWQFLAALLVGGRVHIFPDEVAHDPSRLLHEVDSGGVTVLETVPSLLRLMLDEIDVRDVRTAPTCLRWMIPTGEALPPELCRRWLALYPGVPLVNAYGPTECSDDVTHAFIRIAPDGREAYTPIGRPVPNVRLYTLGPGMRPLPAGVPGELYVGGAGVGRGYLGDGGRTAASWVPDPFAGEIGARLYRTGDLARLLPDGRIEFLGRIDHQVKVRGHRIELGEIESMLASHPAVRQAAVLAREDTPGDRRLVAYVVPRVEERFEELDSAKVGQWEAVFDEVYKEGAASERDAGINLRVWISSYTGAPLPEDEIVECFEDSVARLLARRPSRVLEIGCGTGLLLLRAAPHCLRYVGTDISAGVLRALERRISVRGDLPHVELLHRPADDFGGFAPGEFDAVILNEVVQYFPGVEYLVRVLEGAVAAVAPGGFVFVGGVRSLPLLEAFHTSVELHQVLPDLPLAELAERIRRRIAQEKELVVDPELFQVLAGCLPEVGGVDLQLKGGRSHNELTRFRYDVALRIGDGAPAAEFARLDWRDEWDLAALRRLLAHGGPEVGEVRGVPNARVAEDLAAVELLREGGLATAGELREELLRQPAGIDPADLWDLGRELGYEVEVRWSSAGREGRLDATFSRGPLRPRQEPPRSRALSWSRYANNPLRGALAEGLAPQLRAWLAERLPDFMVPAAFVLLDAFPLSPNGKLDRKALPGLDQVRPGGEESYAAPESPVEEILARVWAQVLRLDRVGIHDNFFGLGGDSILSIQVVTRANQAGVRVTPRQMFQHQTIAELAAVACGGATVASEQGPVTGPVSLTPIQCWFFAQGFANLHRWNQSILLQAREPVDPALVERSVAQLLVHHDALRLRFAQELDGWRQAAVPPGGDPPFIRLDLSALPDEMRSPAIEAAADQVHDGLDLLRGPIARAAFFDLGPGTPARLHLVIHHVAIDGISWRVLLEDLEGSYRALARGAMPALPPKTTSFKSWSERLLEHARSPEVAAESSYWLSAARAEAAPLPVDHPGGANTVASARAVTVALDSEETEALLREVPRTYRTQINDALLTALARALCRWAGSRSVLVDLEGHGREDLFEGVDLSRTVGWFTSEFPVLLEVQRGGDPGEDLKAIKEQLRSLPNRGIGYGILRFLSGGEAAARLASMPRGELIFNYLGQVGQAAAEGALFAPAREARGADQSPRERRPYLLEVNAFIADDRLRASWVYSESLHRRSTIAGLADSFLENLRALIEHCRGPEAGGYTPSDFAAARLSQGDLDKFLTRIGKAGRK